MPLIIGTDEAGYGPNLGPLIISATVWKSDVDPRRIDLEHACDQLGKTDDPQLALRIADSKQVYSSGMGLRFLESAIYSFLATVNQRPETWHDLVMLLADENPHQESGLTWYRECSRAIPVDVSAEVLSAQIETVREFATNAEFEFQSAASCIIEPAEFNRCCDERGNKATVLTESTLRLVQQAVHSTSETDILVVCDKHGGRNKYAGVLQAMFSDHLIRIKSEQPLCSIYQIESGEKRIEFRFIAKGERLFPVALASIFSKYLRELAMEAFNDFWSATIPGIKPTAGYPVDAKRFDAEITDHARRLQIPRNDYWRNR